MNIWARIVCIPDGPFWHPMSQSLLYKEVLSRGVVAGKRISYCIHTLVTRKLYHPRKLAGRERFVKSANMEENAISILCPAEKIGAISGTRTVLVAMVVSASAGGNCRRQASEREER